MAAMGLSADQARNKTINDKNMKMKTKKKSQYKQGKLIFNFIFTVIQVLLIDDGTFCAILNTKPFIEEKFLIPFN